MSLNRHLLLVCPECGSTNRVEATLLEHDPACGRCGAALMAPRPFVLTDATLPRYIARTELPVVVDFWSAAREPGRVVASQIELAALRLPRVRFARVETGAHRHAAASHRIRSLPTLVLFHDGHEIDRRLGAHHAGELLQWLRSHERVTIW